MGKRKSNNTPQKTAIVNAENFAHLLDEQGFTALLESLQQPLSPSIRVNPLKVDVNRKVKEWAERYSWEIRPVPYCPTGWWIDQSAQPVSQTWEHRLGQFYIQDAASMLPAELFDFPLAPQARVLDMAASPGGKTTHLAARLEDQTLVVANDSSTSRLTALRLVLRNWGAANVGITHYPGEQFGEMCPASFDAVLLDAPCSMQGLRSTETHPIRAITSREQNELAMRQERLLESAVLATKAGGQIVYSTCTLTPQEDEGVVDAVLKRFGNSLRLDDISSQMPVGAQGITGDGVVHYGEEIKRTARLWPHIYGTAGFFAARFTRLDANMVDSNRTPSGSLQVKYAPIAADRRKMLSNQWLQDFGFNLEQVLEVYRLQVVQTGREVFAIPEAIVTGETGLVFQAAGLALAEESPNGFIPAHDWITRFDSLFTSPRYRMPGELVPAWLRGSDISGKPEGQFSRRQLVLVQDEQGRFLGLAKILDDRLKNLLPRRLVNYR